MSEQASPLWAEARRTLSRAFRNSTSWNREGPWRWISAAMAGS